MLTHPNLTWNHNRPAGHPLRLAVIAADRARVLADAAWTSDLIRTLGAVGAARALETGAGEGEPGTMLRARYEAVQSAKAGQFAALSAWRRAGSPR